MAEWYKRFTRDALNGKRGLTMEQRALYDTALDLMYEDEGPVSLTALGQELSMRRDAVKRIAAKLVTAGKLEWTKDGRLTNVRAEFELHQMHEKTQHRSRVGRQNALKRYRTDRKQAELFESEELGPEKSNENNAGDLPMPAHTRARTRDTAESDPELPTKSQLSGNYLKVGTATTAKKANDFNGTGLPMPTHKDLRHKTKTEEEDTPVVPLIETVEGEVVDDDFSIPPRRAHKRPIPKDWTADPERLSETVRDAISHWTPEQFQTEAAKFIEDAHGSDRRHVHWDRAFGNWLLKHETWLQERNRRHERTSGWR